MITGIRLFISKAIYGLLWLFDQLSNSLSVSSDILPAIRACIAYCFVCSFYLTIFNSIFFCFVSSSICFYLVSCSIYLVCSSICFYLVTSYWYRISFCFSRTINSCYLAAYLSISYNSKTTEYRVPMWSSTVLPLSFKSLIILSCYDMYFLNISSVLWFYIYISPIKGIPVCYNALVVLFPLPGLMFTKPFGSASAHAY